MLLCFEISSLKHTRVFIILDQVVVRFANGAFWGKVLRVHTGSAVRNGW